MMRKYVMLCFGLSFGFLSAQNPLLENDFWKRKPTLTQVQEEIKKGNNPTEANHRNYDVASQAILNEAPMEVITYLVKLPGNGVDKPTHDGRIYLHWAAYTGNIPLLKWLIDEGSSVTYKGTHGYSPITFGALRGRVGNPELYDLLFKGGVDVNTRYDDGAKIHLLAEGNDTPDLKLLKYFTSKGLDPKEKDDLGRTLVDYAARGQNPELLKQLIKSGIGYTDEALLFAADGYKKGKEAAPIFDYLTQELGVSPKVKDKNGNNVLYYLITSRNSNDEMAVRFLNEGISAEQANTDGVTPLMMAVQRNKKDVVEVMFSKGINKLNATTKKGHSALTYAVWKSPLEMVEFLVKHGADVQVKDEKGNGLAYYAVDSYNDRDKESVQTIVDKLAFLQKQGVNVSELQAGENTLAHLAVKKGNPALVEALKPYVKDWNKQNQEGLTPLHLAAMTAKDAKMIEVLLNMGADKNIKTSFDETVYDLARDNELLNAQAKTIELLK